MIKEFGSIDKKKSAPAPIPGHEADPKVADESKGTGSPNFELIK